MLDPWNIGERRTYRVTLSTQRVFQAGQSDLTEGLTGELVLIAAAYAKHDSNTLLRLTLHAERFYELRGSETLDRTPLLRSNLSEGAELIFDRLGAIKSIFLREDLEPFAHYLYRSLAAELQLIMPGGDYGDDWMASESDATGDAAIAYRRLTDNRYEKERRSYRRFGDGPVEQRTGRSDLQVDRKGRLQSVFSRYQDTLTLAGERVRRAVRQRLQLIHVGTEPQGLPPLFAGSWHELPVGANHTNADKRLAASYRLADVLAMLERSKGTHARARCTSILGAILRAGDAQDTRAVADAVRGSADEQVARALVSALESAFSEHAQAELLALAKDSRLEPGRRNHALVQLGFGKPPSARTLRALLDMVIHTASTDCMRAASLLTLGSATRHAARTDVAAQGIASLALDHLLWGLRRAESDEDRVASLSALGNTGHRACLPLLRELLADPEPLLRMRAVQALRHIPDEDVDTLIGSHMRCDDDGHVRAAAALVLQSRPVTIYSTSVLAEALLQDPDASVRRAATQTAITILKPQHRNADGLLPILQLAAARDPDPDLRDYIATALFSRPHVGAPAESAAAHFA